jgi:GrpB-like predicted nucleotidyltransferase (UPF0157 family)
MIGAMDKPVPSRRRSQGSGPYPIQIVAYDPAWPGRFAELGRELRAGLVEVALRIDHIGSTAVPGLAAKPIIDIQISVVDFEPLAAYRQPLEQLGYVYRADNPRADQAVLPGATGPSTDPCARAPGGQLLGAVGAAVPRLSARLP